MIVYRRFRYRIYPTREQEARLALWESALRFLWNIAQEQRLLGLSRTDKRYPSAFDQINELTELRRDLPWLADVPRNVCAQVLVELDRGWQRCFKRLSRAPGWKYKGERPISVVEPRAKSWRFDGSNIRFSKIGIIRTSLHRPIEGKPKTCTLKRDGDQWFVTIACEIEIPAPVPRSAPVIAIDRGVTNLTADSNGELTANPRYYGKALKHLARAQRNVSRKKKGSKNREKAKLRVARIHRKVKRQREHFLHVHSHKYAKSHGVVVIEKLNVIGLGIGTRATGIFDAGWSTFANMLRYKLERTGGSLVAVPAQYSSQTCSTCGVIDAASRNRERFNCVACGHADHADLNAAKILKQRYETPGNPWCLPVDGLPLEGSGRSRKERTKLRVPRSKSLRSSAR